MVAHIFRIRVKREGAHHGALPTERTDTYVRWEEEQAHDADGCPDRRGVGLVISGASRVR